MIFDFIINGLGEIFGYSMLIALLLIVSLLLVMVSRGVGLTALLGTFFLGIYLFGTEEFDFVMISSEYLVIMVIIFGALIGWMYYNVFIRE